MRSWSLIGQTDNWLNVHAILKKGAKDDANVSNQICPAQNFVGVKETVNDQVKMKLFFKIMIKYN